MTFLFTHKGADTKHDEYVSDLCTTMMHTANCNAHKQSITSTKKQSHTRPKLCLRQRKKVTKVYVEQLLTQQRCLSAHNSEVDTTTLTESHANMKQTIWPPRTVFGAKSIHRRMIAIKLMRKRTTKTRIGNASAILRLHH